MKCRAYLDIETTGLSRCHSKITVIGIALEKGRTCDVFQFVEDDLYTNKIIRILKNVEEIYSYNGSRFDFPFIKTHLKLDLNEHCIHTDLMYDCWKKNLKGGLKVVEQKLSIPRKLKDINGYMAVQLWWQYKNDGNQDSLRRLLEYNKEDVVNLRVLRRRLGVM